MDRRRFVPSPEGLENRALLTSGLFGSAPSNGNPSADVPATFRIKEQRIERLPHFLELIRSGRYLPPDTIKQLQADLLLEDRVTGRLDVLLRGIGDVGVDVERGGARRIWRAGAHCVLRFRAPPSWFAQSGSFAAAQPHARRHSRCLSRCAPSGG